MDDDRAAGGALHYYQHYYQVYYRQLGDARNMAHRGNQFNDLMAKMERAK